VEVCSHSSAPDVREKKKEVPERERGGAKNKYRPLIIKIGARATQTGGTRLARKSGAGPKKRGLLTESSTKREKGSTSKGAQGASKNC